MSASASADKYTEGEVVCLLVRTSTIKRKVFVWTETRATAEPTPIRIRRARSGLSTEQYSRYQSESAMHTAYSSSAIHSLPRNYDFCEEGEKSLSKKSNEK